jgi:hypothetical protein
MLKKFILLICCCLPLCAAAQPMLSAKEMIAVTPLVSDGIDLPADAQASLASKLNRIVTQNGFGSFSGQFVLTANLVTTDKQVTATAPPQYVVKFEASFYVVDVIEQTIIDETSVTLSGVDRLEHKAAIQAINQINPQSPALRTFMRNVRTKIIDYYNTRIPTLLTKAQSLADRNDLEGALAILSAIPESVDQYPVIADQMTAVYERLLDRNATAAILEANGKIALRDYKGALDALSAVDPASTKIEEVFALVAQIKEAVDAKEAQEWADRMMYYEDMKAMALQSQEEGAAMENRLLAARKAGAEQAGKDTAMLEDMLDKWFVNQFE